MIRKTILIVMFSILLFNVIYANETEKERPTYWEDAKLNILSKLDSLIQNEIPISFEEQGPDAQMQIIRGDVREIEYYYKWMCYGTKLTQKWGIDNISKWWYKPKGGLDPLEVERLKSKGQYVVTDADSSYIKYYKPLVIKKLYEFLNDEYPALQVSSARALAFMGVEDSIVIQKLEYYANGTNSDKWNLENTSYYSNTTVDFYQRKGKTAADRKRDAIWGLKRGANQGLEFIYNRENNNNKKNNLLNFNKIKQKERDLDWDGNSSADYCIEYYEI